jgi:hypothetical protein
MSSWRLVAPLVALFLTAAWASAESASSLVLVRVERADGAAASGAVVELEPDTVGAARSAGIGTDAPGASLSVPPGAYRLRVTLSGFRPADQPVTLAPGEVVSFEIRLEPDTGAAASRVVERGRSTTAYRTAFDSRHLEGLPTSRTVWSLAETAHPFLIADRIDGGGLWTGERAMLGGQGSSASQTTFRLDGVDVTDPKVTGTPLFHPDLNVLQAVTVDSAGLDPAAVGPGPTVQMTLRRPGRAWTGDAQVSAAPGGLQSEGGDIAPIARLESWTDGSLSVGGPIGTSGYGLFASGRITDSRRVERERPQNLDGSIRSFTAHLVGSNGSDSELRLFTSAADATRPYGTRARFADRDLTEDDRQMLVSAAWERLGRGAVWSLSGTYQRSTREPEVPLSAAGGIMERLLDGAPLGLVDAGNTRRQRWDVHAGATQTRRWLGRDHTVRLGAGVGGASAVNAPGAQPAFAELVNGEPARVWDVGSAAGESQWGATSAHAFVSDRIAVAGGVTLMAALRFEMDRGSADGAADSISWFTASPRITARWRPTSNERFAITTGYSWYRHRLPLDYFAVGDPAGPTGTMYRWDDGNGDGDYTPSELTAVAAVGLCCTGAGASSIDANLRRPMTGEFQIGVEHGFGSWQVGITGLDRRERHLVALQNVGVTVDDYAVAFIEDPGVDIAGLQGYNPLPIYNRLPESFLRDRYVLGNSPSEDSRYQGVEIKVSRDLGERWYFRFGGSAYRAESTGMNRGYRPDENDQGLLGEAFTNPNAGTYARGRLFYDRAYVMKVMGAYTAPGPLRASVVARYQDGQPFSRVVIAEGLNQGTEIIHTYPRGLQRFTFTLTLDARVEFQWPFGNRRSLSLTADAFNLLETANEVEEDVVTGPGFRTVTAVQPPRVVRLGLRLRF